MKLKIMADVEFAMILCYNAVKFLLLGNRKGMAL